MGLAGGANIAIGIISIVVGVTTGIILLVSGGKLLGAKTVSYTHLEVGTFFGTGFHCIKDGEDTVRSDCKRD